MPNIPIYKYIHKVSYLKQLSSVFLQKTPNLCKHDNDMTGKACKSNRLAEFVGPGSRRT